MQLSDSAGPLVRDTGANLVREWRLPAQASLQGVVVGFNHGSKYIGAFPSGIEWSDGCFCLFFC